MIRMHGYPPSIPLADLTLQALRAAAPKWGIRVPDNIQLEVDRNRGGTKSEGSFVALGDYPIYDANEAGIGGWSVRLTRNGGVMRVELSIAHTCLRAPVQFSCEAS